MQVGSQRLFLWLQKYYRQLEDTMIKKNDIVRVITGDDKGKQGAVIEILREKRKVKVQGVAVTVRHYKARRQGEKSSIKKTERFIDISNVEKV